MTHSLAGKIMRPAASEIVVRRTTGAQVDKRAGEQPVTDGKDSKTANSGEVKHELGHVYHGNSRTTKRDFYLHRTNQQYVEISTTCVP